MLYIACHNLWNLAVLYECYSIITNWLTDLYYVNYRQKCTDRSINAKFHKSGVFWGGTSDINWWRIYRFSWGGDHAATPFLLPSLFFYSQPYIRPPFLSLTGLYFLPIFPLSSPSRPSETLQMRSLQQCTTPAVTTFLRL